MKYENNYFCICESIRGLSWGLQTYIFRFIYFQRSSQCDALNSLLDMITSSSKHSEGYSLWFTLVPHDQLYECWMVSTGSFPCYSKPNMF